MTARYMCIGTHHKTGTVWMRRVWQKIAADQNIPFMPCYRPKRLGAAAKTGPQIIVNWSSYFPAGLFRMDHARFLHIIRDPRDVLLSGMRYHRIAPLGNERFLKETRPEWGGKNYQDYLNALSSDHARLLFEMEQKHAETVGEMLAWPQGVPGAVTLRYEDLIEDTDCSLFRTLLNDFAIEGLDVDRAVQTYWDNSLFGGLASEDARDNRQNQHVSSGATRQWATKLPREVAELYAPRYQHALEALGYAQDTGWVDQCQPLTALAA